jgi:hypothetical protein
MAKCNSQFKPKSGFIEPTSGKSLSSDSVKSSVHKEGVPRSFFSKKVACFSTNNDCFFSAVSPYQVRTKAA